MTQLRTLHPRKKNLLFHAYHFVLFQYPITCQVHNVNKFYGVQYYSTIFLFVIVDSQFWQFRGRPVRPVCSVVIRVGFVLFWKFLYKPTWRGVRLPRLINIKVKADWGIPNRINQNIELLFISQTLVFSNPRLLSSFVSTTFEDVLSGLPTSEQPYVHELR